MSETIVQIFKEDSIPEDYSIFLNDYYLPLITIKGVALYIFLKNNVEKELTEESLIKNLGFTKTDYFYASQKLEVYLLLSAYLNKKENKKIFILKSPLSPSSFFKSQIMCEVLKGEVGDEEFYKKQENYNPKYSIEGYEEITSNIKPYFENLLVEEVNKNKINSFSFDEIDKELKLLSLNNINLSFFGEEDLDCIKKECNIFYLSPKEVAPLIIKATESENEIYKFNSENFINYVKNYRTNNKKKSKASSKNKKEIKINDKDMLAEKINFYSSMTPYEFIKSTYKNKNTNILMNDADIIQYLSDNYDFDNTVINAILDYELKRNNNRLIKYYIDIDIGPILRNDAKDIISVLEILYGKNTKTKVNLFNDKKEEVNIKDGKEIKFNEENEIDFENIDIDELRKQAKENGKNS